MDIINQSNAVLMLRRMLDRAAPVKPCVEYSPAKPSLQRDSSVFFPRVSLDKAGVPARLVRRLLTQLRDDSATCLNTLMILRGGKVVFEFERGGAFFDTPCQMHSLSKSVTAMGVGLAVSDGLLATGDRAIDFFEGRLNPISYITHKDITVDDLLTMSAGVVFAETGAITSSDWVRDFFESEIRTEPGFKFSYNSMNSYILSEILKSVTGMTMGEYLDKRLFGPMGINSWAWEKSPSGAEKGGWGLYLRPEDMAKLGVMWLDGGMWNGQRILAREWVRKSSVQRMRVPKKYGAFNYGYHVWVARDGCCTLFNGMLGQNVFVFPQNDVVVVTTASNGEYFQQGVTYAAVTDAFAPILPLETADDSCEEKKELENLAARLKALPRGHCEDAVDGGREAFAGMLDGADYSVVSAARSVGLLPLITQVIQNNYSSQITRLKFEVNRDGNALKSVNISFGYDSAEGANFDFTFEAGCYEYKPGSLELGGELYTTSAAAVFTSDETDNPVLVIYLCFPELSNKRIIKLYPTHRFVDSDGKYRFEIIRAVFEEVPGSDFLFKTVSSVLGDIPLASVFDLLRPKDEADIVEQTIRRAFSPQLKFAIKKINGEPDDIAL